ncbi:MAG: ParB/RepB/Spo0J family partition protein [Clostridia bacterium]|nr:ParB/RepB/Spo0J family partition protein [Clostridia bacterium]
MKKNTLQTGGKIMLIPPSMIRTNPLRPRIYYNDNALAALAASIAEYGLIEPLTVCYTRRDKYMVISGERRLKAAVMAGLERIPCVLIASGKERAALIALTNHLRHTDLNYFEVAVAIEKLHAFFRLSYAEIARALIMDPQQITERLLLLNIPFHMRKTMIEYGLNEKFAQILLRHEDNEEKDVLLREIIACRYTLSQAQAASDRILRAKMPEETGRAQTIIPIYKDANAFINTIDGVVSRMHACGIAAINEKTDSEGFVEYRIRIPKADNSEITDK